MIEYQATLDPNTHLLDRVKATRSSSDVRLA